MAGQNLLNEMLKFLLVWILFNLLAGIPLNNQTSPNHTFKEHATSFSTMIYNQTSNSFFNLTIEEKEPKWAFVELELACGIDEECLCGNEKDFLCPPGLFCVTPRDWFYPRRCSDITGVITRSALHIDNNDRTFNASQPLMTSVEISNFALATFVSYAIFIAIFVFLLVANILAWQMYRRIVRFVEGLPFNLVNRTPQLLETNTTNLVTQITRLGQSITDLRRILRRYRQALHDLQLPNGRIGPSPANSENDVNNPNNLPRQPDVVPLPNVVIMNGPINVNELRPGYGLPRVPIITDLSNEHVYQEVIEMPETSSNAKKAQKSRFHVTPVSETPFTSVASGDSTKKSDTKAHDNAHEIDGFIRVPDEIMAKKLDDFDSASGSSGETIIPNNSTAPPSSPEKNILDREFAGCNTLIDAITKEIEKKFPGGKK